MIATGLSASTQSGVGIAAATVSLMISYEIGQKFKELAKDNPDGKLTEKQQAAHVLAHAVLGAAVAAAGGNDALAGALSAGGAEAVAPKVSTFLYGTADPEKLTAEQKDTVANIMSLAGAGVGVAVGNTSANAVSGSLNAESAVENNYLTAPQMLAKNVALENCKKTQDARSCTNKVNADYQRLSDLQDLEKYLAYRQSGAPDFTQDGVGKVLSILLTGYHSDSGESKNRVDTYYSRENNRNSVVQLLKTMYPNMSNEDAIKTADEYIERSNITWKNANENARESRIESSINASTNLATEIAILRSGMQYMQSQRAKGLIGKEFEDWLVKFHGGKGSFKQGGREFDGAIGNRWYEAKSGNYWQDRTSNPEGLAKFKSDMGDRLKIAKEHGATYELHSNTPIPQNVKDFLNKKGIKFFEY